MFIVNDTFINTRSFRSMNNNNYRFSNPLVSIIVPVFNSAGTLERCVNSIITQTYKNFELLLMFQQKQNQTSSAFMILLTNL